MFRMMTGALKQVEYFFVGDAFRLWWNRLDFVKELGKSNPQDDMVTTRLGPPIPGMSENVTLIRNFAAIRKVLGTSRKPLAAIDGALGGEIFFSQTGKEATEKHNAFKRNVVLPNLNNVYRATIDQANTVFAEWQSSEDGKDIRSVISQVCLGVVGETMLGLKKLPENTHEVLTNTMRSATNNAFATPLIPTTEKAEYQKAKQDMHTLQVALMKDNQDAILNSDNYIHTLIKEKAEKQGKKPEELITDPDILAKGPSTLLAGENVASLSILVITQLMEHNPEIMEKLYEEIQDIDCDHLTYQQINKLKLLNNLYMEGLRYFSPTSLISRYNPSDLKINDNLTVPKGYVFIPVNQLHHDGQYWEKPDEFNPDRFQKEEDKLRSKVSVEGKESKQEAEASRFFMAPSKHFLPFSAEARICPGQTAAEIIFKVLMVKLVQDFKLKAKPNQKVDITNSNGSTKLRSSYMVELEPRNNRNHKLSSH